MTSSALLLFLCCCCMRCLSTLAGKSGSAGQTGLIGEKKDKYPFCRLDKKTATSIKEITAMLKQTSRQRKGSGRKSRSTSRCNWPFEFPDCRVMGFTHHEESLTVRVSMIDCCYDCFNHDYTNCCLGDRPCVECLSEWTKCMTKCTETHVCQFEDIEGQLVTQKVNPGTTGAKGDTGLKQKIKQETKGAKGASGFKPTRTRDRCPTRKRKIGESYCIERSCIPIY